MNSLEKTRLFVGGLYTGVKEQDISELLKSFGSISSVELVRRAVLPGFPVKTFAFVDIYAPQAAVKKCISILSNTRWKGSQIKVQVAKESFLTRLQKERQTLTTLQQPTKSEAAKISKTPTLPQNLINPIPNAVPGTPVPGKDNWVIGKFGRALPVVYMRPKGELKIRKFDPSKTVHNLKRIKEDGEEKPFAELTWELEGRRRVVSSKMKQERKRCKRICDQASSDSEEEDFINGRASCKVIKETAKVKRKNRKLIEETSHKAPQEKKIDTQRQQSDLSLSKKKRKTCKVTEVESRVASQESSEEDSQTTIKLPKISFSKNQAETVDMLGGEFKEEGHILDGNICARLYEKKAMSPEEALHTRRKKKRNEKEEVEAACEIDTGTDVEMTKIASKQKGDREKIEKDTKRDMSKDSVELNNKRKKKRRELEECEIESKCANDENDKEVVDKIEKSLQENKKEKGSELKSSSISPKEKNTFSERNGKDKDCKPRRGRSVDAESNATNHEDLAKKLESDERRLDAVRERQKHTKVQKTVIASALQNLDSGKNVQHSTGHIVFDDEDDVESSSKQEKHSKQAGAKISGSQASSWLGLDNGSNESTEDSDPSPDDEDDQLFAPKPQFEGKTGEKLFRLQKSYKGDTRFQLDKRFIESDEENEEDENKNDNFSHNNEQDFDDDISRQLANEKELSMSVLRGLLGANFARKFENRSMEKEVFRNSASIRYDPTRDDHEEFEQKPNKEPSPEPPMKHTQRQRTAIERGVPEVPSDKYYDVKTTSLAEIFGAKGQEESTSPFTFLTQQVEEDHTGHTTHEVAEAEVLRSRPWNPIKLPYDSSGDEEEGDTGSGEDKEELTDVPANGKDELFFFHFGDPDLENRSQDEENVFMRTASQDEITEHWVSVRSELTQDYKKKNKDALRRKNKMAAKRARMR